MTDPTTSVARRLWAGALGWPFAIVATLLLTACAANSPTSSSSPDVPLAGSSDPDVPLAGSLEAEGSATDSPLTTDGVWILEAGTVDGQPLALDDNAAVTIDVGDGVLGGQSGCNDYGAEFAVDGDGLSIQVTSGTEVGCGEAVQALEAAYLDALPRVTSFERVAADRLVLTGDGVELVFMTEPPVDVDALVGPTWELVGLRSGESTRDAAGDGFVRLEEDGTMTGSTGCVPLEGTWTRDGSDIVFGDLRLEGDCTGTDELVMQHGFVAEPMYKPMTVTVSGDELILGTRDGRALIFRRG